MADTVVDGVRYAFRFPADASTYTFVVVDTGALDASWRHDADFYIGKGGTGAAIGRRYAAFQEWLAAGNTVEPPEVGVGPQGHIVFGNGRHRFSVLRDMGKKHVVVMVRNEDVVATRVAPYSPALARWLLRDERKNGARVDAVIAGALAYAKPESRMSRSKSSRTFTAVTPDGRAITRTSEGHVYPFVVVATNTQAEVAALQRAADAALATVTPEQRASHARLIEGHQKAWEAYETARVAVEAAGGKTWADPDLTRLLNAASVWSDRAQKHPATRVLGTWDWPFPLQSRADTAARGVGKWRVLGWTSRRDLAEKLASKEKGSKYGHPLRDVRVLETTESA